MIPLITLNNVFWTPPPPLNVFAPILILSTCIFTAFFWRKKKSSTTSRKKEKSESKVFFLVLRLPPHNLSYDPSLSRFESESFQNFRWSSLLGSQLRMILPPKNQGIPQNPSPPPQIPNNDWSLGWRRKEDAKACVTSVMIIMFEKMLPQSSPSFLLC